MRILQYDSYKKSYYIITPRTVNEKVDVYQYNRCGINIGVRTFLTVFSKSESFEIGTNTTKIIDTINNRLDNIRSNYNKKIINKKQFNKLYNKYSDKLKNKIINMHNKTSNFILSNFNTIIIEKVSIKQMVSNLTGNLREIIKRRLLALSHYRFKMKMKQMAVKYDSKILEISPYLTSKNCHNCQHTNDNLGSSKIFICNNCNIIMDRDMNASINIYKNRALLSVSKEDTTGSLSMELLSVRAGKVHGTYMARHMISHDMDSVHMENCASTSIPFLPYKKC